MHNQIREVLAAHGRMAVDPHEVDDQFDIEFPEEVLKKSTFASVHNIAQVVEGLVKLSA